MAAVLGGLVVRVGANIADFETKIAKVERSIFWLGNSVTSLGKKMTVRMTLPLAGVGVAAVKAAADFDGLRRGLVAVAGSTEAADRQLRGLREVAKMPGLGFAEAIQGSINLQAAGFSAALASRSLAAFGNALATVGRGKAELDGVTTALTQIASKGKISAEEINQLAERLPQIRAAMQSAFGTSNTEALQKLGIDATTFVTKVVAEFEKLPRASGGASNYFANLRESIVLTGAAIGRELLPPLVALSDKLERLVGGLSRANPQIIRWGVAFGLTLAAVGPLTIALGGLMKVLVVINAIRLLSTLAAWTAQFQVLAGAITILRTALISTAAVMVAGGALVAGLALVSTWLIKNKLDAIAARGATDEYANSLRSLSPAAAQEKLGDLSRQLAAKQAQLAALPAKVKISTAGAGDLGARSAGPTEVANPAVKKLKAEIAGLNEQYRIVVRVISDSRATMANAIEGGVVAPLETATDRMRRLAEEAERLNERLGALFDKKWAGGPGADGYAWKGPFAQLAGGASNQRQAFDHTTGRRIMPNAPLAGLNLRPVTVPSASPQKNWGDAPSAISQFTGALKSQVGGLAASFGPLAIAAAVLAPVMQGLAPVFEILKEPLRIIGQIIGVQLTPVLKLLAIPLRVLAKASSYVAEGFGWLLRAIGKFVDSLPGISAKGLIAAGQEMMDGAKAARQALDGTAEAANKLAGSLSNLPPIFDLELRRRQAALAGGPPPKPPTTGSGGSGGSGGGGGGSTGGGGGNEAFYSRGGGLTVVIQNPPARLDTDAVVRDVERGIIERQRRGGTTALSLSLSGAG